MIDLFGYLSAWSVVPGETLTVHVAARNAEVAIVDLVELGRGDEQAEVDGVRFRHVPSVPLQSAALAWQETDAGSYALIRRLDCQDELPAEGTLALLFQPWDIAGRDAVVVSGHRSDGTLALGLDATWRPFVEISALRLQIDVSLVARRWYVLTLEWSLAAAQARLVVLSDHGKPLGEATLTLSGKTPLLDTTSPLVFAGRRTEGQHVHDHFNGRIEHPAILYGKLDIATLVPWLRGDSPAVSERVFAEWDFSKQIGSTVIEDRGPNGLHGELRNIPKRAVRGARWSGQCLDWRQCPQDYAAIHFHDDDLDNANWAPSARILIPNDIGSGAYAVRVRLESEQLLLPLFIRAQKSGGQARIGLVFPTYTYLAYANDHTLLHGNGAEVLAARAVALEPTDVAMAEHPEWGLSLYDTHTDGSGVSLSSRWRPIPTFTPDQRAWQAGEGSGRWNYSADLLLVEWLNREGIAWEALTDEDIDREGGTLLDSYDVLLTGSHPEYATPAMVGAYKHYIEYGGRMLYLGGNGFYWKVATARQRPGVIELRRAEDGNRAWAEEPGEYFHQLDGSYGGLWRRSGVAPQSWLGVGYSGQGFRRCVGYRRAPDSERAEVAFVFAGVAAGNFGERGAIGGGCAGIEVDRADELLGSPREGYLLGSSLPFDETYFMANEELLVTRPTIFGKHAPSVRSDIFLLTHESGGAVFSTGSIAWIGGLVTQAGDPAVQRITRNVIERFLDAQPVPARPPDGC